LDLVAEKPEDVSFKGQFAHFGDVISVLGCLKVRVLCDFENGFLWFWLRMVDYGELWKMTKNNKGHLSEGVGFGWAAFLKG
jgi:hypothetical protein